jgi:beta-glucosidase
MRTLAAAVATTCTLLVACGAPAASAAGRCGAHPWCDTSLSPDGRANLLVGQMTNDEKAAFLGGDDVSGVLGGEGTHTGTQQGVPRLELPTIYYSDGPQGSRSGQATAMPGPMALAATFDRETARTYGALVGDEVRAKGNDVVFAPTINVMRTPLGGRTFEGYGEDPFLIGQTAVAWIKGAQSQGVIADVKHFAENNQEGIGAAPVGVLGASALGSRMTVDVQVDERTLREIELTGFEAAVKQGGAGSVMCSYNKFRGDYVCQNKHLIQDILEGEWGFKGFVLSDYGANHDAVASLNNGLDFEPWPGVVYRPEAISAAVAGGQVAQKTLDDHVRRILRTMFAHGALDHAAIPYDNSKIDQAGHKRTAGEVAEQAATLLRNQNGQLPLDASRLKRIALIGSDAETFKNRGGSAGITPFSITTPREAITQRAGSGVQVTYDDGSDTDAAVADAKAADVAIVFASDSSIEGKDKTCLNLTCPTDATLPSAGKDVHDQDALIEAVAAAKPQTVVVLQTGGPVLTPWRDRVPAILEAWDPGENGGTAVARVLFGDVDPGGRLPVTFPNSLDDEPTSGDPEKYPGVAEQVKYKEGVFVGYRWFDEHKLGVAYPFGYGLSYTTFSLSGLRLEPGSDATVSAVVENTGTRAGTAVPQLYLGLPNVSKDVQQPPRQLKGYAKVTLKAGEAKRVSFPLDERAFSYWNTPAKGWRIEPGCYTAEVGFSSRDLPLRGTIGRGQACSGELVLPASRRACTSRRLITITLPKRMRSARVTYAGRRAKTSRRRGRMLARIDLRRLPRQRVTIRVRGRSAKGRTLRQTRVFRTCTKKPPR